MSQKIQFAIRVDASHGIGTGHVYRCLSLAQELRSHGAGVLFICQELPGNLIWRIQNESFDVLHLPLNPFYQEDKKNELTWSVEAQSQDAQNTIQALQERSVNWMIVDHYGLDAIWEDNLRSRVKYLMVIDDLANRHHACDILFDQNYFGNRTEIRYQDLILPHTRCLLGPHFSLLQPAYCQLRNLLPPHAGKINRLLIFFGGSDVTNETEKVLDALIQLNLPTLVCDVVLGANYTHQSIRGKIQTTAMTVIFHQNLPTLAGLMAKADLFIGAGGSTTWERMCLGLPSIVVSVADNQRGFSDALVADQLQLTISQGCEATREEWSAYLEQLITQTTHLQAISEKSKLIVDGRGAYRVACELMSLNTKEIAELVPDEKTIYPAVKKTEVLRISILSDASSWMRPSVHQLQQRLLQEGHDVCIVHLPSELNAGDVCLILSCSNLIKPNQLALHRYNLVVHADNLPTGRGWSPMTWQILAGNNLICMTLFEAVEAVDAGPIYQQVWLELDGTELIDEWREKQAIVTERLCLDWIKNFPASAANPKSQQGEPTFWPRRRANDSRLDINKSLGEQFNLLRVVDNDSYPAFFEHLNQRYQLRIEKVDKGNEI